MVKIQKKVDYLSIVDNILNNEEFNKLGNIEHHGTTRLEHSIRVSYYSYKVTKFLKLDYIETARAGLLHDFFLSDEDRSKIEKFTSTFNHSKKAVDNASKEFGISHKEENIIRAHMFPFTLAIPKYAESWIVIGADKTVAAFEFVKKFKYQISYAIQAYILFFINKL